MVNVASAPRPKASLGRRRPLVVALLVVAGASGVLTLLGSCQGRSIAQPRPPAATAAATLGSLQIDSAYVALSRPNSTKGSAGHVEATIRNTGTTQDRLLTAAIGATTADHGPPAGLPVTLPAGERVDLGPATGHTLLAPLDTDADVDLVTFTFADAGSVTMQLPVATMAR